MKKLLISLFIFCIFSSLFSLETYNIQQLSYNESEYYKEYKTAQENNEKYDKLFNIINKWGKYIDGDCYFNGFLLLNSLSYIDHQITIPTNLSTNDAYSVYYPNTQDLNNSFYIYRNHSIHIPKFNTSTQFIKQGIGKFTNRFDLWDVLINSLSNEQMYIEESDILRDLIDFSLIMDEEKANWYIEHNALLSSMPYYTDFDTFFFSYIKEKCDTMIEIYPDLYSAESVYLKLLERYPGSSFIYNELGLIFIKTEPSYSLFYFTEAYKLDNKNYNAIMNISLSSFLLGDETTFEKYKNILYSTEDETLINDYENKLRDMYQMVY